MFGREWMVFLAMSRIIAVTSGKGGVGKSTISAGLGQAFARLGRQTLILELDAGLRGLDIMLGVENSVVYDLGDLLAGDCTIEDALVAVEDDPGLSMIAAPSSPELLSMDRIAGLCANLRQLFDVILIDTPAGVPVSAGLIPRTADMALVAVTPDYVSVRDSGRMVFLLAEQGFRECSLIINKVNLKYRKMNVISDLDEVMDGVGIPLLGVIPEELQIKAAFSGGLRLEAGSAPEIVFERIAARMEGTYIPLLIE